LPSGARQPLQSVIATVTTRGAARGSALATDADKIGEAIIEPPQRDSARSSPTERPLHSRSRPAPPTASTAARRSAPASRSGSATPSPAIGPAVPFARSAPPAAGPTASPARCSCRPSYWRVPSSRLLFAGRSLALVVFEPRLHELVEFLHLFVGVGFWRAVFQPTEHVSFD